MEKTGSCRYTRKMKGELQNDWACQDSLPSLQPLGAAWQPWASPCLGQAPKPLCCSVSSRFY